ncbi:MAG: quinone-dependent dihydroorotate dehydrogenase [Verrucomicrobiales bacterium]|nr:quinone-dependent dihydroorotate dehydrogenase [Verrucomicrobiales bacterium]
MPDFYKIARKVLFSLKPETAHHLTLSGANFAHRLGLLTLLTGKPPASQPVEVMGLTFPNRIGLAAGMDKSGRAVAAFGALGFGHVEIGTITPRAQPGNPQPRLFRLREHQAIINRMGFNNPGMTAVLANLEKSRQGYSGIVGINLGKNFDTPNENAIDDYLSGFRQAYAAADYIAINLSSPNTKGLRDLQAADTTRGLITALQEQRKKLAASHQGKIVPIAIKIAPDLSDQHIADLAQVFNQTHIDAVIATNTTIDRQAVAGHAHADEAGGLSGRPVTDRSTEVIRQLRQNLTADIPIIGVGGIFSAEDAQNKLDAGATLVQIYTGLIYQGPSLIHDILKLN